ncbi:MAG: hypothetical protein U9N34_04570 [Candidatus Cloacimonadota bacterium]|nr:hypothetical protein [Candidatus Cloacimonadota bacterium]
MKIKFRDVSSGIVDARAVIEVFDGVFINEITILKKGYDIIVEIPQKSFKGKDKKMHYIDILTFENYDKKTLWLMEVKEEYSKWRQNHKKVLIYQSDK